LKQAKRRILVQAYGFTSKPIVRALVEAHQRGVAVKVILDKSNRMAKHSLAPLLLQYQIPVLIDSKPAIAHNKIMVIDDTTVITGSFNFTKAAQFSNAENVIIIHDKRVATRYTKNWDYRLGESQPFEKLKIA